MHIRHSLDLAQTSKRCPLGIRVLAGLAVMACGTAPVTAQTYRSHTEIGQFLSDTVADHGSICQLYDLGSSVQGRELWALRISDNVPAEEDEPEFKYISTMHGNEIVGNEMCLYLIDHLTDNYGVDPDITHLVDEMDIWIMPLMNPDGYMAGTRTRRNANGVDLNRDFPDPYTSPNNTPAGRAAETGVVMNWCFGESFTLSANIHTGALVVNYPLDNNPEGASVFTPSPDEDLFVYISEEYSQHNSPMWNGSWYHGITNGAAWYRIDQGMQDWNYHYLGCNEVTLEISNDQSPYPAASQLPTYWNNNRDSMLAYMATALIGVRGIVTDAATGLPRQATVTIEGRDHAVYTDPDVGDYHRMLLPGTYTVSVEAKGYDTAVFPDLVVHAGDATRWDVALAKPATTVVSPNGGETLEAGVSSTVSWTGNSSTAFQVQYSSNYGENTVTTEGFESGSLAAEFVTGGDVPWFVASGTAHGGTYAARSGAIDDDEVSWMTRSADGGEVSFWYRVGTEDGYDDFNFYIDDILQFSESGSVAWTYYSTTLGAGPHTLKWEYDKDFNTTTQPDTVWIDDLTLTQDNTTWFDITVESPTGATSTVWVPTTDGANHKVRCRTVYGGGAFGGWDESDAVFTVLPNSGEAVPTVSEWGAAAMALLIMTLGTLIFRHRFPMIASATASSPRTTDRLRRRNKMNKAELLIVAVVFTIVGGPSAFADSAGDLFAAVRAEDAPAINALLVDNPDLVSARDQRGNTPLHIAAAEIRTAAVESLLAADASPNTSNKRGERPLHLLAAAHRTGAARQARAATARMLIAGGAEVNARDDQRFTPLHVVAVKGCSELLAPLMEAGADIMAADHAGRTPLHHAAMNNHKKLVGELVKLGAKVNATDAMGETPLHAAARRFKVDTARQLIADGAKADARSETGATPLIIAASQGPSEPEVDTLLTALAEVLLDNGAAVNATDQAGFTPLHYAKLKGRTKLAALLEQRGGK